jgi:hypothetical protein
MPSGLDLPGLLALAPEGGALVVPMISPRGGAAFVIPHGTRNITAEDHCVMLDDCSDQDVAVWLLGTSHLKALLAKNNPALQGWLPTYYFRNNNAEAWFESIEHTGQVLWKKLIGPIHQRLVALGLRKDSSVLLITPGGTNLLSLHAAWRESGWSQAIFHGGLYRFIWAERLCRPCKSPAIAGTKKAPEISPCCDQPD